MKNRNLFSGNKTKNSSIKYFIISFSVFIVLLAVSSVVLFMHSLDYDISNSQKALYNLSKYITDWNYGDENYS